MNGTLACLILPAAILLALLALALLSMSRRQRRDFASGCLLGLFGLALWGDDDGL